MRTRQKAHRGGSSRRSSTLLAGVLSILGAGCSRDEVPGRTTFYEREIAPTLDRSCARSAAGSGCHVSPDDSNAFGNLDVTSYERLTLRRDLFESYGPYGIPGLLLKVVPPYRLALTSWKTNEPTLVTTDIAHQGGRLVDFTSPAYSTLERWLDNGAAENNAPAAPVKKEPGPCSPEVGEDPLFDASVAPDTEDFDVFVEKVNPVLGSTCAGSNCHGSPANSLYLSCGDTEEQVRWNYFAAADYVAADPEASEILRRTLSPSAGGTYHEGGEIFRSKGEPGYAALSEWAALRGAPANVPPDEGFEFFADRVQPMLVKRGCMMLGCHSPSMFHDYRLRGGSGGHFGLPATRRNYLLTLEQLALESPDPNASRLLRKNLPPAPDGVGIKHRGGPLLARPAGSPECDLDEAATGPLDEQDPYCVIVAWFQRERAARLGETDPFTGIAFVRRPASSEPDRPQDFEVYQPGAEVVRMGASYDEAGAVVLGAETSLSALCGLNPTTTDARRPAVSWDGTKIAFSARSSASEPFRIYVVEGDSCEVESAIDAPPVDDTGRAVPDNGELIHNFDPAFSPDGRIVFASTRGNVTNTAVFSYEGPQRTPADPSKLNSNLYVRENDGSIRQLTFLLNQELTPSFMRDGRVILVAEKRAPGFYQLAGRRINLDGGDYHPLFGQRSSVGFNQYTDVVELADKNFAAIFSMRGAAHGAGTLAIANRSVGIDQASDNPEDYLVDPDALSRINEQFFQHSITIPDPAATGRAETAGAYRNPSPLPNGKLLVSYAPNVVNLESFSGNFDVYVFDPITGEKSPLVTGPDDELWPVAIYKRTPGSVFASKLEEPNGSSRIYTDENRKPRAKVTYLDVGVLASLLFQNTRTGRPVPEKTPPLFVWESLPPEPGVTSFGGRFSTSDEFGDLYVRRQLLGQVLPESDGSAAIYVPGGAPVILQTWLKLAGDSEPTWHFQREEVQFYPGEEIRQGFRRELFDGICAGCHGSVSGIEMEAAVNPDILTSASSVEARDARPVDLTFPVGDPEGPDFP
jgi:hypothetical protein